MAEDGNRLGKVGKGENALVHETCSMHLERDCMCMPLIQAEYVRERPPSPSAPKVPKFTPHPRAGVHPEGKAKQMANRLPNPSGKSYSLGGLMRDPVRSINPESCSRIIQPSAGAARCSRTETLPARIR